MELRPQRSTAFKPEADHSYLARTNSPQTEALKFLFGREVLPPGPFEKLWACGRSLGNSEAGDLFTLLELTEALGNGNASYHLLDGRNTEIHTETQTQTRKPNPTTRETVPRGPFQGRACRRGASMMSAISPSAKLRLHLPNMLNECTEPLPYQGSGV